MKVPEEAAADTYDTSTAQVADDSLRCCARLWWKVLLLLLLQRGSILCETDQGVRKTGNFS